jgi:hypothetical protein
MFRYINTDLDLVAPQDLTAFAAVLESKGFLTLHKGRHDDGLFYAVFEITDVPASPEQTLQAMLGIIEGFAQPERDSWLRTTERVFNIGYDCGSEPWAFNNRLSTTTLRRMAEAGAALQITLYPPETKG